MNLFLAIAGAYIIGSIDFAVIVARMRGVDIRGVGSGNPGTSNVLRTAFLAGLAAVVGHCYPIFHRFKGGRGVATGLGVLFWTVPWLGLGALIAWLILVKLTKVAALASLITVLATLPAAWIMGVRDRAFLWVCLMVALIVFRHRDNIARLIKGSEQKVPT